MLDQGLHRLWGVQENKPTLQLYLVKKHSWRGSKKHERVETNKTSSVIR